MNGELRPGRMTMAKRGNSAHDRTLDYQRVPSSLAAEPSPLKRPRASSSSSSFSSTTAVLKMKSSRVSSKNTRPGYTSTSTCPPSDCSTKLKMAELLAIKRELTAIKVQIDSLLDCVDEMDRQMKDCSECPRSQEPSVPASPCRGSLSSLERESPEPGEASEEELLHYQHYYPHRVQHHQSDQEENL